MVKREALHCAVVLSINNEIGAVIIKMYVRNKSILGLK